MIVITKMTESNFEDAVAFIARLQLLKEHHIGYFGIESEEISAYIRELEPDWQKTSLLAYKDKRLVGIIIAEYDMELKRAWIHGPMIDHQEWDIIADKLFNELMSQVIPISIDDFELFGEKANSNLKNFANRHAFPPTDPGILLRFPRKDLVSLPRVRRREITKEYYENFQTMHARIFPKTYYSGKQILNMLDRTNKLFIETEEENLIGFIHGKLEKSTKEGYIEFVGVDELVRRKGYGKKLVIATIQWLFDSFPQINNVNLTVSGNNQAALNLYTKLGFNCIRSYQGYRKKKNDEIFSE